jgi:3-methylcrotonyl-CoA carboxylase alpha subunit
MIAKLVVHGASRAQALQKMRQALDEFQIIGLSTNVGFLSSLLGLASFACEEVDTGFIENHYEEIFSRDGSSQDIAILLASLALLTHSESTTQPQVRSPWHDSSGWRMNQPARRQLTLNHEGMEFIVDAVCTGAQWHLGLHQNDYQATAQWQDDQRIRVEIDAQLICLPVIVEGRDVKFWFDRREWHLMNTRLDAHTRHAPIATDGLIAPMPGNVVAMSVAVGDSVQNGDLLLVMEAMKMEHTIVAQGDGIVKEIFYNVGDQVNEGDRLLLME